MRSSSKLQRKGGGRRPQLGEGSEHRVDNNSLLPLFAALEAVLRAGAAHIVQQIRLPERIFRASIMLFTRAAVSSCRAK